MAKWIDHFLPFNLDSHVCFLDEEGRKTVTGVAKLCRAGCALVCQEAGAERGVLYASFLSEGPQGQRPKEL